MDPRDGSMALSQLHSIRYGSSCLPCRMLKKRCNGIGPRCGRCEKRGIACSYPGTTRRLRVDRLEGQLAALEGKVLTIANAHDKDLLWGHLFGKIRLLNDPPECPCYSKHLPTMPMFPLPPPPNPVPEQRIIKDEWHVGYRPEIRREALATRCGQWDPRIKGATPGSSLALVQLFLPFRIQFHFYMDVSHFIDLFLNRADYFHPSLLNAIYMAACSIAGGRLGEFVEYFRECTRVHIQESLANADRMTHALWAALILGCHATRNYRIAEAYAIVSSAASFAVACGLDFVNPRDDLDASAGTKYTSGLLPPPTSKAEVLERSRLAYAIFMCDRCLAVRGYPSVFTTSNWMRPTMHRTDAPGLIFTDRPPDAKLRQEMDQVLESDAPPNVKSMFIMERVEQLALWIRDQGPFERHAIAHRDLKSALSTFYATLPSLCDTRGIEPSESISKVNPHLIVAHVLYHGSALMLSGLAAENDEKERAQFFKSAQALAKLCSEIRGASGLKSVHGFIVTIHQMTNAIRAFTAYLKRPEIRTDNALFASCCESLSTLIDFHIEISQLYPSWSHVRSIDTLQDLLPPDEREGSKETTRALHQCLT